MERNKAVLVEAISAIIRVQTVRDRFPGGWAAFAAKVPNKTLCSDNELARVGFMGPTDCKRYVDDRALEAPANHEPHRKHVRNRAPPHGPVKGMPVEPHLTHHVFELVEAAQKGWLRLDGNNQLPKLVLGVKCADGLEVVAKRTNRQTATVAA